MKKADAIQQQSIKEFGTPVVQERYRELAEAGLWESEEVLIEEYFEKGSKVLDVACGSGRTALPLSMRGYNVVGVDLTPGMIAIAKEVAQKNSADIEYHVADVTSLSFKDAVFDNVLFSNNGLGSIPGSRKRQQALNEIFRVLKPGGHLILSIPLRYYAPHYLWHWVKTWCEHILLTPLGYQPITVDFGDFFYHRHSGGKALEQVQFMHFFSQGEAENIISDAGFTIVEKTLMSRVSPRDGKAIRGSLSKKDDTAKSPIFYICQKPLEAHSMV